MHRMCGNECSHANACVACGARPADVADVGEGERAPLEVRGLELSRLGVRLEPRHLDRHLARWRRCEVLLLGARRARGLSGRAVECPGRMADPKEAEADLGRRRRRGRVGVGVRTGNSGRPPPRTEVGRGPTVTLAAPLRARLSCTRARRKLVDSGHGRSPPERCVSCEGAKGDGIARRGTARRGGDAIAGRVGVVARGAPRGSWQCRWTRRGRG